MKQRKIARIVLALAVVLALTMTELTPLSMVQEASAVTQADIDKLKDELSGMNSEKAQLEKELKSIQNNKNTALDRASILNHIWGESYYGDDKIVDVNIRRIRMKIEEEPSSPKYIITIWGYGYKWNDTQ